MPRLRRTEHKTKTLLYSVSAHKHSENCLEIPHAPPWRSSQRWKRNYGFLHTSAGTSWTEQNSEQHLHLKQWFCNCRPRTNRGRRDYVFPLRITRKLMCCYVSTSLQNLFFSFWNWDLKNSVSQSLQFREVTIPGRWFAKFLTRKGTSSARKVDTLNSEVRILAKYSGCSFAPTLQWGMFYG